jgi:manganese/zinc/iron transport system substrate-binding protein
MIGDILREVGGERVEAAALMGEGVDPHLYRPTRADLSGLLAADIVFYNGLALEGRMGETLVRVARAGKPVFAIAEALPEDSLLTDEAGHPDPHVWMDPTLWARGAGLVAEQLAARDSAGAEAYRRNLAALQDRLAQLDAYCRERIASIPATARVLVTAHDAFAYFGRRYGLEVQGIQGLSTESEVGVRRIEELVGLLAERRVPAVFVESSVPDRAVQALVEGAARRGHRVTIGATLYSDAMGPPGTYEGTYIGMMDHNATRIAQALGGEAPARGLHGRLAAAG